MSDPSRHFARPRPGEVFGPFRLLRELGSGHSGVVYLAQRTTHDERGLVALKLLRPHRAVTPQQIARLRGLAATLERERIPNICPIDAVDVHEGVPYLVLRFLNGQTLAHAIAERESGSVTRRRHAATWLQFEKLARALHRLHERGLTHRDLKPENVLLDDADEPWLLDFGSAMRGDDASLLTGSPAYLAPELLTGHGSPSPATDLYAFGITLFEVCTGRLPHVAESPAALMRAVTSGRRPSAHDLDRTLPVEIDQVLDRLLAPDPAQRYADAAVVAEDLRRIRQRLPLAIPKARIRTRVARWLRANRRLASALSVLLATLPLSAWMLSVHRHALHTADLLATHSVLAAAKRAAETLLPCPPDRVHALRQWLAEHAGDHGLQERRQRLRAASPNLAGETDNVDAAQRSELEQELEALDRIPAYVKGMGEQPLALSALPALLPAMQRHRAEITRRLDQPRPPGSSTTSDAPEAPMAIALRGLARELDDALAAEGLVARMHLELGAAEATARSAREHGSRRREIAVELTTARDHAFGMSADELAVALEGLVPLGPDPHSGLHEFALARSGQPPRRGADGRWRPLVEDAVVFVLLPGGTFAMGAVNDPNSPHFVDGAQPDEGPVDDVTVGPFLLAKHELTKAQWRRLGGRETSILRVGDVVDGVHVDDRHPAEGFSFTDAERVLRQAGLVLPTEAQWEFAARRGGITPDRADHAHLRWSSVTRPACHVPVGVLRPDRSGLHDLHGNVPEMVADAFGNYDLATPRPGDGFRYGWRTERVCRGGGFFSEPAEARAAARFALPDFGLLPFVGIRPVFPVRRR